jgi:c-di-GMP-binding flagellar brake protein YcgR
MADDVLSLAVGSFLQLQAVNKPDSPRYQVRTIGYLPGGSVVVTTPLVNGKLAIVRPGQFFTVRMLRGESVMGFEAQVLQVYNAPYPHIHLAYPKQVERTVVRNARRVTANLPAKARNIKDGPDGTEHPVRFLDLSMTGVKLVAERPLGAIGDVLQLGFGLEVAGKQEQLVLLGTIRNLVVRDRENIERGYSHGMQFSTINRFQQVLLHGWVLQCLTEEEAPAV